MSSANTQTVYFRGPAGDDLDADVGEERLGVIEALRAVGPGLGPGVVMRGQVLDLLDVEDAVRLHERDVLFDFVRGPKSVPSRLGDRAVSGRARLLGPACMALSREAMDRAKAVPLLPAEMSRLQAAAPATQDGGAHARNA